MVSFILHPPFIKACRGQVLYAQFSRFQAGALKRKSGHPGLEFNCPAKVAANLSIFKENII
jgi:hypothetical protein